MTIANRVRKALASLWSKQNPESRAVRLAQERALKLQNYFTQPFYCAEPWTKRSGATVARTEALRACREILDGAHDDVSVEQFYFRGGIDDIDEPTDWASRSVPSDAEQPTPGTAQV